MHVRILLCLRLLLRLRPRVNQPKGLMFTINKLLSFINKALFLPGLAQEGQFLLVHVSTASSPHNQGVFVEDTNKQIQCIIR